jgi:hypothetical protein
VSSAVLAVREALVTSLATIAAGATYTHTLTASGQVRCGLVPDYMAPLPMVRLLPGFTLSTNFGRTHHDYLTRAVFSFVAIAAVTEATTDGGLDVAESLLEDIETRLAANLTLSGACEWVLVENATLWGAIVEGVGDAGVVEGEIAAQFVKRRI